MKTENVVNLILGGAVALGFVWTQLKSLPKIEEKVQNHEVRLAVMENNLTTIRQGVELLVREKRGSRRGE